MAGWKTSHFFHRKHIFQKVHEFRHVRQTREGTKNPKVWDEVDLRLFFELYIDGCEPIISLIILTTSTSQIMHAHIFCICEQTNAWALGIRPLLGPFSLEAESCFQSLLRRSKPREATMLLKILSIASSVLVGEASCVGESCPVQSESLIQHQVTQVARDQKVQTQGFHLGHDNTQSCNYDRERIEVVSECQEAAAVLGLTFGSSGAYYAWPAYCIKYRDVVYYNSDVAGSRARADAYLVCKSVEPTTTTTTVSMAHLVSYHIGTPGAIDCAEGHVVSTYTECASTEVRVATNAHFSNWIQTHDAHFGCLYNSNLNALFFNYFEGGTVDHDMWVVCKTESYPVARNFDRGDYDTNICPSGSPIDDADRCREAAAFLGERFMTSGSFSGYPLGCFSYSNGDVYFNSHPDNLASANAAPICVG